MKTKKAEEILARHNPFKNVSGNTEYFTKEIIEAMHSFAASQSQAFAEWCETNYFIITNGIHEGKWYAHLKENMQIFATSELFELWKEEVSK